jgi:proteasome assembly chaperone (PAC2) family protein
MQHVRWSSRPRLRRPVLVAAFEGWNDAGDAATGAARFLRDRWLARPFADIDPEDFYDFTSTRPQVRIDAGMQREIVWPSNELSAGAVPGGDLDVIVLLGTEPQLRWRTFCDEVTGVANELGARMVITLGALLAEVAHSRPVSVIGTAFDPDAGEALELHQSRYEGPTGIVGVLHDSCRRAGLRSASLWAAVPTYVPGAPSPKAALALVERTAELLKVSVPTTELEIASASYERQVSELVAADEETAEYVAGLEARHDDDDDDFPTGESLVEEVERFLRDTPPAP